MDYRVVLGVLAVFVSLVGYVPYFRNILSGKTKPHAFSWFVWAVISGIAFGIQYTEGAGPGAWAAGFTALICVVVFLCAFRNKNRFPATDWVALIVALVALVLWLVAKQPLVSAILVSATDALAFVPTYRKGFQRPYEDTPVTFGLNGLKFFLSLFALQTVSITTWIYPASLVITNWAFVIMMYVRRSQIRTTHM
ncbi:MAG TPA: hypothetical protein VLJ21_00630 [Candidatus Binatia bacterium]|nr:hypothetical protein [Candidatus Binatia bacterium]